MSESQEPRVTKSKHLARLLIHGLTAADVEQVQAVVNNLRHKTFNDWHLVEQAPADLALIGHDTPGTARGPFIEAKVTLELFEPATHRPCRYGVLVSPLRYVALSTALTDVDRRLAARRASAPDSHDASSLRAGMLLPLRRRGDVGLRAVMMGQARVRLRRRPPVDLAAGHEDDAALIRLLMTGHLSFDELLDASQQTRAACCALLRELSAAALLDIQMPPGALDASLRGGAPEQASLPAIRASNTDDDRSGLPHTLWRELGFLRS